MPRPRTGRPRIEDAVALRIVDLVGPGGTHGPRAFASAELRDLVIGASAGSVSWSTEIFDSYGRVTVTHRRAGQPWASTPYIIELTARQGPLGPRWWLLCAFSGRRASTLFLPNLDSRFASREHHGLAYASQGASPRRRAEAKASKIRLALGGSADFTVPFPERPRGMHAAVYERRRAEAEAASMLASPRALHATAPLAMSP